MPRRSTRWSPATASRQPYFWEDGQRHRRRAAKPSHGDGRLAAFRMPEEQEFGASNSVTVARIVLRSWEGKPWIIRRGAFELATDVDACRFVRSSADRSRATKAWSSRRMLAFRGQDIRVPVINISSRGTMVESDILPRLGESVEDPLRRLQPDLRLRPLGPRRPRRPQVRLRDDPGLRPRVSRRTRGARSTVSSDPGLRAQ